MNENNEPVPPKTAYEIRNLLKTQRKKLKLTQFEIANILGENNKTIVSFVENGQRNIPRHKICLFAKAYQITEEILAPLVHVKDSTDVLPLIKILAASTIKEITAAEFNKLASFYNKIVKEKRGSTELSPELQRVLFGSFCKSAGPPAN